MLVIGHATVIGVGDVAARGVEQANLGLGAVGSPPCVVGDTVEIRPHGMIALKLEKLP